jgi:hypothetical protein
MGPIVQQRHPHTYSLLILPALCERSACLSDTSDPKLLLTRPEPEALGAFSVTSLERQTLRDLLLPADLGIPVTPLNADRYTAPADVSGCCACRSLAGGAEGAGHAARKLRLC